MLLLFLILIQQMIAIYVDPEVKLKYNSDIIIEGERKFTVRVSNYYSPLPKR